MHELPQSVRNRLAAQQTAGEHPDADLLTAFAEQALSDQERERVTAHLAQCATCREVVSLAAPPEEAAPRVLVMPAPTRTSWFSLPLVRWGIGVAAACIVLAAAILYKPQPVRGPSEADLARMTAPAPPSAPPTFSDNAAATAGKKKESAAAAPKPATADKDASRQSAGAKDATTFSVAEEKRASTTSPARRHAPGPGGPSPQMSQMTDQLAGYQQQVPSQQQPAVGREARAMKAAPAASTQAGAPAPPAKFGRRDEQAKAAATLPSSSANEVAAGQAAESVAVTAQSAPVEGPAKTQNRALSRPSVAGAVGGVVGGVPLQKQRAVADTRARTLWNISAQGKLQRSSDGVQWQTVQVANVTFRTVATVGTDVWVGGSGGALYHSSDNGETWQRAAVGTPPVTDAITRLDFSDARTGMLTTASGEAWATHDGGATWSKATN